MYSHEYSCPVDHILREVFTHRKLGLVRLTPSYLTAIHNYRPT